MDKQEHKAGPWPGKIFCGECGTKIKHRQSPLKPSSSLEKDKEQKFSRWFRLIFPTIIMIAIVVYCVLIFIFTGGELVPFSITAISFSTDNNRLISVGTDRYLQAWDITRGKSISRKKIPSGFGITNALAWDPDDQFIALARTYPGPKNNEIQFFNSNNLSRISSISAGSDVIAALCIDSDGNTLYSVTNRLGIGVWDVQKGERLGGLKDLPHRLVSHATFDRRCQRITTIEGTTSKSDSFDSIDQKLVVYQRINMETLLDVPFSDEFSEHPDLVGIMPDGKIAITIKSLDQNSKTTNIDTGETKETTLPNLVYPSSFAMGVSGNMALGGRKGLIHIYDSNGLLLQTLRHASSIGIALQAIRD
jgi:WD40 repeat protein